MDHPPWSIVDHPLRVTMDHPWSIVDHPPVGPRRLMEGERRGGPTAVVDLFGCDQPEGLQRRDGPFTRLRPQPSVSAVFVMFTRSRNASVCESSQSMRRNALSSSLGSVSQ